MKNSNINHDVIHGLGSNVKMKDSGIEWIGKVPEHWKACRFKDFIKLCTDTSNSINKIGLENIESGTGRFIETSTKFEGNGVEFKKDSIVYGKLRPYLQKVWMAEFSGNAVGDFFVFNARKNAMPAYIKYVMLSDGFTKVADRSTAGAKMPRVSSDFILSLNYCIPSLVDQQRMVTYLDTNLSEIDHQVSLLTSKRDAYLRLKKSIINHAVTRGLNPNVKMKDSGIEWIGEVPEHWEVKRLKNVVECNAKSLGENTPKDSIIKYVEISDVDHVHGINNIQSLMFGEAPSRARRITQKGDIIISTVRTYLKAIAKIEDDDIIVSTGFAVLHPTKCNGEYLAYYILSESFINRVEMLSKGTSYPAINASDLVSINVLIPPLPEQHDIATYLGDKCAKIDTIVSNLDKQISRYADLKRSLIDEVITGKRAV